MKKWMMGMMIALLAIGTMAAAPEALPELQNFAAMKAKSATQIAGGTLYVSGNFVNSTNSHSYVVVPFVGTPEEVLREIMQWYDVSFEPISTNDDMAIAINLNDNNGRVLFSGYNWFKMKKNQDGQWILPSGANVIKDWWLSYRQPVQIGKAGEYYGAYLYIRNDAGKIIDGKWYEIDESGKLMFPQDMVGAGTLIVYGSDGSQVAYDLRDGGKKITGVVTMQVEADMSGIFESIPETIGTFTLRPQSYGGHGEAKPIRVNLTVRRTINLIGSTSEGERAIKVTVLKFGTSDGEPQVFNARTDGVIPVELEPGKYIMYYTWENGFDTFDHESYYPYGDKGG